jgi:hypothetical protein
MRIEPAARCSWCRYTANLHYLVSIQLVNSFKPLAAKLQEKGRGPFYLSMDSSEGEA